MVLLQIEQSNYDCGYSRDLGIGVIFSNTYWYYSCSIPKKNECNITEWLKCDDFWKKCSLPIFSICSIDFDRAGYE